MQLKKQFQELVGELRDALPDGQGNLADQVHRMAGGFRREIRTVKQHLSEAQDKLDHLGKQKAELRAALREAQQARRDAEVRQKQAEREAKHLMQALAPPELSPEELKYAFFEESMLDLMVAQMLDNVEEKNEIRLPLLSASQFQDLCTGEESAANGWAPIQRYAIYIQRLYRVAEMAYGNDIHVDFIPFEASCAGSSEMELLELLSLM